MLYICARARVCVRRKTDSTMKAKEMSWRGALHSTGQSVGEGLSGSNGPVTLCKLPETGQTAGCQ